MSDSGGDPRLARIEQGLNALFATEVATEILEAVDFEAILAEEPVEEPVDVDRLAEAVGRPLGRYLAHRIVSGNGAGAVATRAIGSEVGGRVAGTTLRVAVERVDLERVADGIEELDESVLPGPTFEEVAPVDPDEVTEVEVQGPADAEGDADDGGADDESA